MHGWDEAWLDYCFLLLLLMNSLPCGRAEQRVGIVESGTVDMKIAKTKVAPAAKLLAVFCIPFLSVLKDRM